MTPNDKPKPDTVLVYDPADQTTTAMPAREMTDSMMKADISGVGSVWIDAHEAKKHLAPSPIQHPALTPEQMVPMHGLSRALAEVRPMTPQQWEEGFRKDTNPHNEIALWLRLACAYGKLVAERIDADRPQNMRQKQKTDYFNVLLRCINVPRQNVVQTLPALKVISTEEVEIALEEFYSGEASTVPCQLPE
jgi:hypothetical protein